MRRSLLLCSLLLASCGDADAKSDPATLAADSLAAARHVCEDLVRDRLLAPSTATFEGLAMHRNVATGAQVGRGEVTASNPSGVPIRNRFVCVVDVDRTGKANVVMQNENPALYREMVRTFGLDEGG